MNFSPPRRGNHRKRISSPRLSSDSAVPTLPAYSSPPWQRQPGLLEDPSDKPPDYDSAEEADADTDTDESNVGYISPPPPLPASPRRVRRSQASRSGRRQLSAASDPYLDSLLARSVHALEMSNALLQSSMSTQSSLTAVLSSDSMADRSLEARAQILTSRIRGNRDLHGTWTDDLDEISRSVENLVGEEQDQEGDLDDDSLPQVDCISKSLPTSGFAERVQRRHLRRPSLDLRNSTGSHLQYSNHDRSHFVAPAPRALTMYIDSTDDPDLIILPPTLGLRSSSHLPPTPLPSESFANHGSEPPPRPESPEQTKRIVDVLSSYVMRSPPSHGSSPSSASCRLPPTTSPPSRRSSITSSSTIRKPRQSKPSSASSKSPSPSRAASIFRSRSLTPLRTSSPSRMPHSMTPPIEELSASSTSSSSDNLHIDRTLESLRLILGKQPASLLGGSPSKSRSTALPTTSSVSPRPSFLSPPTVEPVLGTSNATASISRLFTKARHSSSTRAPSPPRQSSMKNRSVPPTPAPTPVTPTPPPSLLGLPDALGISGFVNSSTSSVTSSGHSTPKRISFAELPESYASSKPGGVPSKFRDKARSKSRSRDKAKRSADGRKDKERERDEGGGWWTGWLLGAAGTESGSGLSLGATREERIPRSPGWSVRSGFGNSWEEWGA